MSLNPDGTVTISQDDLNNLVAKVQTITAAKSNADQATAASNAADAALAQAQQAANDAKVAEATADGQLTSSVKDLETFVTSLAGDVPAPAHAPAPTPPAPPAPPANP